MKCLFKVNINFIECKRSGKLDLRNDDANMALDKIIHIVCIHTSVFCPAYLKTYKDTDMNMQGFWKIQLVMYFSHFHSIQYKMAFKALFCFISYMYVCNEGEIQAATFGLWPC